MGFDLVIYNAAVIDGTGSPAFRSDIGIEDGLIAAIDTIPNNVDAAQQIDAEGMVLTPGFVDIHTHSDVSLLYPGTGLNKVCQGVTTEVTGNCGFSAFPLAGERLTLHADQLAYLGPDVAELTWHDFAGYAEALEAAKPIQNIACLVGHGTLRIAVAGLSDDPYPEEAERLLCMMLEDALEQGAFGFSTGLTYVPSRFGSPEEITRLARVAAGSSALYATHSRATAGQEGAAIEEAISVGRDSGVRVEFSHLAINDPKSWGSAAKSLAQFDAAQSSGVDIQFDVYPYDASASSLSQYLPLWLQTAGPRGSHALLTDSSSRARALSEIASGWYGGIPWLWDRVLVTQSGPTDDETPGHTLAELAESSGREPAEVLLALYERYGNAVQVAMFYRTEADMREFLCHPASVVGSDGVAMALDRLSERPHPRFYGTFPRVLGRYVRDTGLLSLENAIRKMTGEPADRCRLTGRGYVKRHYAADLVLFSPGDIADRATFLESNLLLTGLDLVIVNGKVAVEHGRWSGTSAGKVLRRGASV